MIEFEAEVDAGSASPAAAAFSVTQELRGVVAGGLAVIVLHDAKVLIPRGDGQASGKPCPVELDGSPRIASYASDALPGSAPALFTLLDGQRLGVSLLATDALRDVSVYVESTSHPRLVVAGIKYDVGNVEPKKSFIVTWGAECRGVPAGRHLAVVLVKATGFDPVRLEAAFEVIDGIPGKPGRPWYEERFGPAPSGERGKI